MRWMVISKADLPEHEPAAAISFVEADSIDEALERVGRSALAQVARSLEIRPVAAPPARRAFVPAHLEAGPRRHAHCHAVPAFELA